MTTLKIEYLNYTKKRDWYLKPPNRMENIRIMVNNINENIKSLTQQLLDLQNNCKHDEQSIRYDEESKSVIKKCLACEKNIGYPTHQELKDNDYI